MPIHRDAYRGPGFEGGFTGNPDEMIQDIPYLRRALPALRRSSVQQAEAADRAIERPPWHRLTEYLPEGVQPFFESPVENIYEDPGMYLRGLEEAREFSTPLGSDSLLRSLLGASEEIGPDLESLFRGPGLDEGIGEELLGERDAPYQDIGEQHRVNEDIIRLLMETSNPSEFGGPAGYGLPRPPSEPRDRRLRDSYEQAVREYDEENQGSPTWTGEEDEALFWEKIYNFLGEGKGAPRTDVRETPESALDAMERFENHPDNLPGRGPGY